MADTSPSSPASATGSAGAGILSRRWMIFGIVGVLSLIADQATKIWARSSLPTFEPCSRGEGCCGIPVPVVEHYFDWRMSCNPGSAFGLFSSQDNARIFLSIVGVLALGAIVWMVKKARADQTRLLWALGLVAGGAIGNLIDRIYTGVVTDFVVWKYKTTEWPTFNIADVALVVGVGLLFIDILKDSKTKRA
jgi:signal peptidase II